MTPVTGPARSARLSVAEVSTDVRGRYDWDCKTAYTGSLAKNYLRLDLRFATLKTEQPARCGSLQMGRSRQSMLTRRGKASCWA
jgi:hypothetical protein